jgi:membrane protease YdiL (CAAX protease family)
MSEFALGEGSLGRGIGSAVVAAVKYLAVPILLIVGFTTLVAEAGVDELAGQLGIDRITTYLLVLGIPITALSFFRGYYPKGSRSRMTFGVLVAALVCVWIWVILMGGNLSLDLEEVGLSISFVGLVMLFVLAAALGGVYYVVEMFSYRKEWLTSRQIKAR